ncbi:MAG TPA: hypothetical protein VGF48_10300 [Thermoanaerobaculia bacterium]|jgi:hypothetical protein
MEFKPWYKSRTLWLALGQVFGGLALLAYSYKLNDPVVQKVAIVMFLTGLAHFGIRVDTTKTIA